MGGGIGSSVCWFQNALYGRGIPPTAAAATNTATIAAAIAAHCYFLTAIFCNIHEYKLSIHGTWSTSRDPMLVSPLRLGVNPAHTIRLREKTYSNNRRQRGE